MPEQPNFVAPDLFDVSDGDLHIVYSTTGFDGRPHLSYQDPNQMLAFTGDEIRSVETDLGTVVSVTIRRTVDAGSTSFSLLVPRVNVVAGQSAEIRTEGITTIHRFSIVPAANRGQRDYYTVRRLTGTASQVPF